MLQEVIFKLKLVKDVRAVDTMYNYIINFFESFVSLSGNNYYDNNLKVT